jgi:hypothetical protein
VEEAVTMRETVLRTPFAVSARDYTGKSRRKPSPSARGPPPAEAFAHTIQCIRKALSRQTDSPIMGWPSPALPCIARDSDASRDAPQLTIILDVHASVQAASCLLLYLLSGSGLALFQA